MASSKKGSDQREHDSEECARIYLKQAVAHHCVAQGFTATTDGVLECLTDVAQHCIEEGGLRTMENTNRAGRFQANVADLLQGLLQKSVPVKWTELKTFGWGDPSPTASNGPNGSGEDGIVGSGEEVGGKKERVKRWDQPFHNTVPPLPLPRKRPAPWDGEGKEAEAGGKGGVPGKSVRPPHVPSFLPPPPVVKKEASEASGKGLAEVRLERLKRKRQAEAALRNLEPPLPSSGIDASSAAAASTAAASAGSLGGGGGSTAMKSSAKSRGSSTVVAVTESSPSGSSSGKIIISKKRRTSDGDGGGAVGVKGEAGNGKRSAGASASSANGSVGIRPHAIAGSGAGELRLSVKLNNGTRQVNQGRPQVNQGRSQVNQGRSTGFKAIVPNASAASARMGPSAPAAAAATESTSAGAVSGLPVKKTKLWKGSGVGARGPFGRASDLTKEERILEGLPPDGHQGDVDGGAT